MQSRQITRVAAKSDTSTTRHMLMGSAILLGAVVWAGQVRSDRHDPVTVSHGYSNFDELMYPADYPHWDYVNPDAPKGGEISQWSQGTAFGSNTARLWNQRSDA